ncbi:MAG: ECF transporter S component [Oscillospiraceae bacterium]|nr:ECF transporter S component [Oscillospiraceae bacterium]
MSNPTQGGLSARRQKTKRLVSLALLTAIVVVLQLVATFVRFGPFSITLALIPIIVGSSLHGPKAGAFLGGVFGVVVLIACITGADMGGAILWNANPFLTAVLCLVKGIAAGFVAGLLYTAIAKSKKAVAAAEAERQKAADAAAEDWAKAEPVAADKKTAKKRKKRAKKYLGRTYLGVIIGAISCPIVNTGIFCAALALFYHDILVSWAGGAELLSYVILGLTGVNFLIEFIINVVLSPVVARIVKLGKIM